MEQKVLTAVEAEVQRWEGVEGVVAWMGGGRACKIKTRWWLEAGQQQQQHRWYGQGAVRVQAAVRRHKRELHS